MLPAPMRPSTTVSALVEEALLDELRALLRRDLDVARREHEDAVGDPLHAAVERVGQATGEVDEPPLELVLGRVQVQHDRDPVLEAVGDLLRVVEALGDHEVDAHPAAAVAARAPHGAQLRRGAPGWLVVGEDVVEVVAATAVAEAPHVRALAVALLE